MTVLSLMRGLLLTTGVYMLAKYAQPDVPLLSFYNLGAAVLVGYVWLGERG